MNSETKSMSAAKVDVLAVMDGLLAFASRGVERDDPARQMIEAAHEARATERELSRSQTNGEGRCRKPQ